MEPFELIDPIEPTAEPVDVQTDNTQQPAPETPEDSQKTAEEQPASQQPSQSTDTQEKTLFGW